MSEPTHCDMCRRDKVGSDGKLYVCPGCGHEAEIAALREAIVGRCARCGAFVEGPECQTPRMVEYEGKVVPVKCGPVLVLTVEEIQAAFAERNRLAARCAKLETVVEAARAEACRSVADDYTALFRLRDALAALDP